MLRDCFASAPVAARGATAITPRMSCRLAVSISQRCSDTELVDFPGRHGVRTERMFDRRIDRYRGRAHLEGNCGRPEDRNLGLASRRGCVGERAPSHRESGEKEKRFHAETSKAGRSTTGRLSQSSPRPPAAPAAARKFLGGLWEPAFSGRVHALKMEAKMLRLSFLSALFSVVGITSVVASPAMRAPWVGDLAWLIIAATCVVAVMASESESA